MKSSFLNLFMKKFTRERVVPTISARVSRLTSGITVSVLASFPARESSKSARVNRLRARIEQLINQVRLCAIVTPQSSS